MMQSDHNIPSHQAPHPTPDQKIKQDLSTLTDQITLCRSILNQSFPSDNDSLQTVVGFLTACVPRMVELIEAAAQGALGEDTLEECLVVNDTLTNVLEDVKKGSRGNIQSGEPEIDLGLGNLNVGGEAKARGSGTEEFRSDPFSGPDFLDPKPASGDVFSILDDDNDVDAKPSGMPAATNLEDEDFDSFFKDRTSSKGGKHE